VNSTNGRRSIRADLVTGAVGSRAHCDYRSGRSILEERPTTRNSSISPTVQSYGERPPIDSTLGGQAPMKAIDQPPGSDFTRSIPCQLVVSVGPTSSTG
jgi:hypothetical protein